MIRLQPSLVLLTLLLTLQSCVYDPQVKPWEKENLAQDIMRYEGLHPEVKAFESHIYFSKEASSGGSGVAGGGCGCN